MSSATPRAAVAIVHAALDQGSVLLLRRRDDERDHFSGHWCLPGGRRDERDVDLVATALRELREECGLVLGRDALAQQLAAGKAGPPTRYVLVAPFVFRIEAPVEVVPRVEEMVEARWLSLADFGDASRHVVRAVPGQPPELRFPTFDLSPVPLWGFTYRLLRDWAVRAGGQR